MVILSEEEVSPSSVSCSSSSSSATATPRCTYEVFLSFRGEDTGKNFTDHLYTALKQKGINTFRNDERLERGKPISLEILKTIVESRFAVIVLSRNYVASTWCLEELTKIVECMKETGMIVLPVFYGVDPSEVRYQRTFGEAFAKHEEKQIENVKRWRSALREVTNLSGWDSKEWYDSKIIHQIVEKIFQNLCDTFPRVTKGLVGIHFQVKHLDSLLCVGLKDIRVIGIWGMGGIGKTTLAKVVYDRFSSQFEGCSFIENIKDFSKVSDLITLQQHLLVDILEKEDICIKNVDDGVNSIKDGLGNKKILLVLDDVNNLDQLKYLANERNWFGFGSRIIITTRDKHLLSAHKVDGLHECKILNNDDALQLFCLKAFEKEQPQEGFEEISQKFVDYADGLPLALDVLGSLLACRGIHHWKDAFKRLKRYPEAKIFGSLKMSYDGLDNETEKSIFIYIACFLRGRNQGLVTNILESLDLCLTPGMNVLIGRSLITISNDIVQMHGLLQDMTWEILRKQSPAEPGNRRGLKLLKDVFDVLENNEGTDALEIIDQDLSVGEVKNCTCSPEAFSKMTNLRFLKISNVLFPQGLEFLSNELRILQWHRYPLKSLPSSFQPKEIWELCMSNSQIEKLWDEDMAFPNLRSIDLSCSENLIQTPNLAGTPSLEKLDLHDCKNLVHCHPSIFVHKRLNHLSMSSCSSLESLPPNIEMESLITLDLSNCSKVKRIPEFGKNMKCLENLVLGGIAIEEIPSSIKHLTSLKHLNFSECSKLGKPPSNLGQIECLENLEAILEHLCSLEELNLEGCNLLIKKKKNLEGCNLFAIPNTIGCLSSLESLFLDGKVILSKERKEEVSPSSSSFVAPLWKYDVFLSFRGKDTCKGFTDHLYTALKQNDIHTFWDDERLKTGKPISPELLKAIEESRFAVIVFSTNYAGLTWCLDELAKIVECRKEKGLKVFPVFYDVTPSEVHHQTGTFAEAFDKHKERFKENIECVERWRSALREVADLSGFELGERYEAELITEIVGKISEELWHLSPRVTKGLVGIPDQLEQLNSLLSQQIAAAVHVIGIWGMGGMGKTTLARAFYERNSIRFEGCSFIDNVKDIAKDESGTVKLQQQLLSDILNEGKIHWSVIDGVQKIKKMLRSKKILLVLDDVNHKDQLNNLVEERDWLGHGSTIIITTRDQHLLKAYEVDGTHKCEGLNPHDSRKLLCLKAFKEEQPKEGFEEISQNIVEYAKGLPLALDVLGSLLVGKEELEYWEVTLEKLKDYPDAKIVDILEISYRVLDEHDKRIFIYIACFLKGKNQGLVIDMLKGLKLYPKARIDVLIDRSLITISKDNIVGVHDLLQDMAWEILHKQSPRKPGKRIGLKLRKDILDVLTKNKGTKAIEIINQEPDTKEVKDCTCGPKAFLKMTELRFLRISNVLFPQGIEYLSNELLILEWYNCPLKSLPSSFRPNEIFELIMPNSQIESLWEGAMDFPSLRSIDLSCSKNLIKTPDLTGTPKLESLDLHGCTNLVEGHPSILVHKSLTYLNLAGCILLENLPSNIEMESLETLILSNCSKVKRIPEFGEKMKCLKELYLDGTAIGKPHESKIAITEMHSSRGPMISLRSLEVLCCLEGLDLSYCNLLAIPNDIGCLLSLDYLSLEGNNFVTLPATIRQLSNMKSLNLRNCKRLQSLPEVPLLLTDDCSSSEINVSDCPSLESFPEPHQNSKRGQYFTCPYFVDTVNCPKLEKNNNSVAIVKRHLQEPYDRKVPFFESTSGWEIPQWFTHQHMGSYVSVELPPNWCDSKWMGFALCASFSLCDRQDFVELEVSVYALLPDSQFICGLNKVLIDNGINRQAVWYVPKDTKAFELFNHINCNQCSGNVVFYFEVESVEVYHPMIPELELRQYKTSGSRVEDFGTKLWRMKCGVRLVNQQDVEELKTIETTSQATERSIPPSCLNCPKLNEHDISVAILKHHIQEPYDRKVPFFETTIYGWEIPPWFTHQYMGNYVSVELPPNWCDSKWMGFALCASFSLCDRQAFVELKVSVYALLPDSQFICGLNKVLIDNGINRQAVWYVPKDTKAFELFKHINCNQCSGNIVFYFEVESVEVYDDHMIPKTKLDKVDSGFKMKCGVRLVNKQDVEELKIIHTTSQASGRSIPPSCLNCPKLNEPDIIVAIIKHHIVAIFKRYLQWRPYGFSESCLINTFSRGDEIPQWFTHQNVGKSVSMELSPNWCDSTWMGFAVYALFNGCDFQDRMFPSFIVRGLPNVISIRPKRTPEWSVFLYKDEVYSQAVWFFPTHYPWFYPSEKCSFTYENWFDQTEECSFTYENWEQFCGNIVFYFGKLEFDFGKDNVDYGFEEFDDDFEMKCGARLVYKQDVEELIQTKFKASGSRVDTNSKIRLQMPIPIIRED